MLLLILSFINNLFLKWSGHRGR